MPGYGMLSHVGLVRETSLGVLPGARTDFFEALSESISLNVERIIDRNLIGARYEPDDLAGLRTFEGDIVCAAFPETLGHFASGLLGVSSTAEVASGTLYSHTFTYRTAALEARRPMDSFSLEVYRDVTSAHHYLGCCFNKLALNVQPNQALQCTLSLVGISATVGSASTPTFVGSPTDPFAFNAASVSLGGAASVIFEALNVEIDNQLTANAVLNNSNTPHFIDWKELMVNISGTVRFQDLTEYNNFINQTEQALVVSFHRANSFHAEVDIPRMVYTTYAPTAAGRERLTVGFEGKARYHSGSGAAIEIRLTDNRSGYLIG